MPERIECLTDPVTRSEKGFFSEALSFPLACDIGQRVLAVASEIKALEENVWPLIENNPQSLIERLRNVALTSGNLENNSVLTPLINRHVILATNTLQEVALLKKEFQGNPQEFFRQAFGFNPSTPDLQILYRPTGVYFLIRRSDYNRLKSHARERTNGFVSLDDDFTRFPQLKKRVAVVCIEDKNRKPREKEDIACSVKHEERHLLYLQHISFNVPKAETVEQLATQQAELNAHCQFAQEVKDYLLRKFVIEQTAYGGVNDIYSLSHLASGRLGWRDFFQILRRGLNKYSPEYRTPVRNVWLEIFGEYLQEEKLIKELGEYVIKEVSVITDIPQRLDGENNQENDWLKKETLSGLPKDLAEIVFTLMVPQRTDTLLEGLGFQNPQTFLEQKNRVAVLMTFGGRLDLFRSI